MTVPTAVSADRAIVSEAKAPSLDTAFSSHFPYSQETGFSFAQAPAFLFPGPAGAPAKRGTGKASGGAAPPPAEWERGRQTVTPAESFMAQKIMNRVLLEEVMKRQCQGEVGSNRFLLHCSASCDFLGSRPAQNCVPQQNSRIFSEIRGYSQSFGPGFQAKLASDNYFHIECDPFSLFLFAGLGCQSGVLGRMRARRRVFRSRRC
jgi:hypothetical protein